MFASIQYSPSTIPKTPSFFLGVIDIETKFNAIDGLHKARIDGDIVSLQMGDVNNIELYDSHVFLDTGSPHHVEMVNDIKNIDVKSRGAKIRYGEPYNEIGSNVNFVEPVTDCLFSVRTYERGVEDETLSCGTGVTAAALVYMDEFSTEAAQTREVKVMTRGGELRVKCSKTENGYQDIWLCGPATKVYEGMIDLKF